MTVRAKVSDAPRSFMLCASLNAKGRHTLQFVSIQQTKLVHCGLALPGPAARLLQPVNLKGPWLTSYMTAGNPVSVIHHLHLGVWSFLASPAQGLKESTRGGHLNLPRLLDGFVEGSRSLASNVALAVSSATAKTTNAARKGLVSLGLDRLEATGQWQPANTHERVPDV